MKLDEEDIAFNFDSQESTKISIDRLVSLLGQPIVLLGQGEALLIVAPGPGSFVSTRRVRELLLRRQQPSRGPVSKH